MQTGTAVRYEQLSRDGNWIVYEGEYVRTLSPEASNGDGPVAVCRLQSRQEARGIGGSTTPHTMLAPVGRLVEVN